MAEPVTLADIKGHLRLDVSVTDEDAYLSSLLVGARRACELKIGRAIVDSTLSVVLDGFPAPPADEIALPGGTVSTVSIDYVDSDGANQTFPSGSYVASLQEQPSQLAPVDSWPGTADQPGAVTVSYDVSALSSDDLEVARQAIRLTVGSWYSNREGAVADQRGTPAEVPLAVSWLLEPLVSYGGRL